MPAISRSPAVAAIISLIAHSGVASAAEGFSWTPRKMLDVKRVACVQPSPAGAHAAYTVRTAVIEEGQSEYLTHIWLAKTDGTQSWQLTRGDKSCEEPQWSPNGKWLAFVSKRAGKANLWRIDPAGGEAIQLTDLESDVTSFRWSPDGKRIAFTALEPKSKAILNGERDKNDARLVDQNIRLQRLYYTAVDDANELEPEKHPPQLTHGEFNLAIDSGRAGKAAFDWSPNGKQIVFSHTRSPSADDWPTADLSLVDVITKQITTLIETSAAQTSPRFSPDGKRIAFVGSDRPPSWGGRKKLYVIPASGGQPRELADTKDDFGRYSELIDWSASGEQLIYSEIQGTEWKLLAMPLEGQPNEISSGKGMSLSGAAINCTRTMVGYSWENFEKPAEAVVTALEKFAPITVSKIHHWHADTLIPRTEVIRWKSTEDFEIEGLLTYPTGYIAGQRYPLLVVVHGGPMGAFTRTCDASPGTYPIAAFAERGYAVLRANVRGSSGYGGEFRAANYEDWGGGDYRDLMAGVDHVIKLEVANKDRLGIMGWSYGGYMTSWTITQTNRFRAASVGAGVTNLVSFTGTADIPGFLPDYFNGEFWDKPAAYFKHSPMFQIRGVRTPTLVQHGERDERVPLSQGQELYNALKRQKCETKMVIYPRTPHGIEEPALLVDAMERNLDWFEHYLPAQKSGRKK